MAKRILLADDSVTIQKVVELTFMDEDYEVVSVGDGREALAKLGEVDPALMIVDVHMPGADGYEVCRRVKAQRPDLPVLLLVGTFETFDEAQAEACDADGHLKKPFDSQDLLRRVEELAASRTEEAPQEDAAPAAVGSPSDTAEMPTVTSAQVASGVVGQETVRIETISTPGRPPAPPDHGFEAPPAAAPPTPAPVAEAPSAPADSPAPPTAAAVSNGALSDEDVERIAKRVAEMVGETVIREIAWEVLPDLAEVIIKERIRALESQVE